MIWPSVTIAIATHGRTGLLPIALDSALNVRYPGTLDILIDNDCPEQVLSVVPGIGWPQVTVINHPAWLGSLGAKRNDLAAQAHGEWLAWLDDDDMLLPWHLLKLEQAVERGAKVLMSEETYWFCGGRGEVTSTAASDCLMHRDAVRAVRYPDQTSGEEWEAIRRLQAAYPHCRDETHDPTYVQIWGNGAYHLSGQGNDLTVGHKFRADVLKRMAAGEEPRGHITIVPKADLDYQALCEPIFQEWRVRRNHTNPLRRTA